MVRSGIEFAGGDFRATTLTLLAVDLGPATSVVPVRVQAPGAFRPADYERGSTDQRSLGCQVRIEVSGLDEGP